MNFRTPNSNDATQTRNRSRDVVPSSGLCSRCEDSCRGNCEAWKAAFRGRELIYPGPFGEVTAGADKEYPVDYSHLNIAGYAMGAKGLPEGVEANPDTVTFPAVDTETSFGYEDKVKMKVPIFTGALGSTEIARKHWQHFSIGAAISGVSLVCGENVCGIDPGLEINDKGMVTRSPDMERRIELYRRFHEGYGDILVQLNLEDRRLGVAEYVIDSLGVETIELKWGQGAKSIGGEIKVGSLERAVELKRRGYIVTPDPSDPTVIAGFNAGAFDHFERHSRLGFLDEQEFYDTVDHLRSLGAKRVTLKTGAYTMRETAMALKWASKAKIDLLTFDGAGGGTGMSPWGMMEEWGVPTFYLQSMVYELAEMLAKQGEYVPDLAMAGGFSNEEHVFKVLSMGAPHFKAVCMGRALMIPAMAGANAEEWIAKGDIPNPLKAYGSTKEELFLNYEALRAKYGKDFDQIPLGAIGFYTFADKIAVGLQQIMAGSRNMNIESISRRDVFALTEEAAKISGIDYIMDAYRQEAIDIIKGK